MTKTRLVITLWLVASSTHAQAVRVNKAIELLSSGQPVYYTTSRGGYEDGKALATTWADYINYDLEHGAFDMTRLRAFMRGLVDGGPTASGHRTPAVIVTLPALGIDEVSVRANHWMIHQVLAAGVHGVLLCHARTHGAARAFVEATRYPFHEGALGEGLGEGLRGSGSQVFASEIWGITGRDYLRVADPWPLNPDGELLLGLKIEDRHALEQAESSVSVPGIGFAEWGPGDMAFSFGFTDGPSAREAVMQDARTRVLEATKTAGIAFLNAVTPDDVIRMLDDGVMIGAGGREAAEAGRRHTRRRMPW